jgi:hypothetical protein
MSVSNDRRPDRRPLSSSSSNSGSKNGARACLSASTRSGSVSMPMTS